MTKRSRWCVKVIGILLLVAAASGAANSAKVDKKTGVSGKSSNGNGSRVVITDQGGALIGYYHWEDMSSNDALTIGWTDYSSLSDFGTLGGYDDDIASDNTANDFNFTLFGTEYKLKKSAAYASTNGWLSFIYTTDPAFSASMPNENLPNATLAPFWADLLVIENANEDTLIKWYDNSGNGEVTWYWKAHPYGDNTVRHEFEIKLVDDSDGDTIYFIYHKVSNQGNYSGPSPSEFGIEDPNGEVSVEFSGSLIDAALGTYDYYRVTFYYASEATVDFNSGPTGWTETNIAGDADWTFNCTDKYLEGGSARFTSGSADAGSERRLVTPVLNLKDATAPAAFFWFYHSDNLPNKADSLFVDVSLDGGATWTAGVLKLARYSPQAGWKKYVIDLRPYIGYANVKLGFRGKAAGGGEDMYIDYFKAFINYDDDVDVVNYTWPEHVLEGNDDTIKVRIANRGFTIQTKTVTAEYKTYDGTTWGSWTNIGSMSGSFSANSSQDIAFTLNSNGWSDAVACSLKVYMSGSDDGGSYGQELVWYVPVDKWDRWDDGTSDASTTERRIAVRFFNPQSNSFSRARLYITGNDGAITQFDTVYVVGNSSGLPDMSNVKAYAADVEIPSSFPNWLDVDFGTIITANANDTLWVVVVQRAGSAIKVGVDKTRPNGNSYYYAAKGWTVADGDYMVRLGKALAKDLTITGILYDTYVDAQSNDNKIRPKVTVKNVGSSDITGNWELKLFVSKDGGSTWEPEVTETFSNDINSGSEVTVQFANGYDASSDAYGTQYTLKVVIGNVEGSSDDNQANDTLVTDVNVVQNAQIHSGENGDGWKWEDDLSTAYSIGYNDYDWKDITTSPDGQYALEDDKSVHYALPFSVKFYGNVYDSIWIGANGAINFADTIIPDLNQDLSTYNSLNKALVAPFWEDLSMSGSNVYVKRYCDNNPPDTLIIEWNNVSIGSDQVTFQLWIINTSSTGDILFKYQYKDGAFTYDTTAYDPTVGIYNNTGTGSFYGQFSYDENPITLDQNRDYVWLTVPKVIVWRNPQPTEVGEESGSAEIPSEFQLFAAKPSVLKGGNAEIKFALPKESDVSIVIYDAAGRTVRQLVSGRFGPGYRTVSWDGRDDAGRPVTAGVYFFRMVANNGRFQKTQKLLLLR